MTLSLGSKTKSKEMDIKYVTSDHFLTEKVMVFDNFLAADKHK